MPDLIGTHEGRALFGFDPGVYDRARPAYPEWVYQELVGMGALGPSTGALEIGSGTGLATRRLLGLGADPLTVVEPDERFHPLLRDLMAASKARCRLLGQSFEDAELDEAAFDLIVAATSFHWIDETTGLARCARVLRPGGRLALWWNLFGDLDRADAFHEATRRVLEPLATSPSGGPGETPFALDRPRRTAALTRAGFIDLGYRDSRWTLTLDTEQIGALYLTFASIQRLAPDRRDRVLEALMEISERDFGGRVERNMTTALYTARAPHPTGG